ncbi:DUF4256 domain-containing protein [Pedobacter sp. Leaf176]|uniref:DUF4256 domain-containing protein n=1 Tax=Pedobacter sp. Leaf176 TaxID=1736286 RepID=UPI0006F6A24F|nr:DUF4256 domain-containing protein [Pedobacter sp. Leaf176]KQR66904.1 hypothetical protein ASF92_19315 [Pedobacter sp. Leaf176]
MKNFTLSATQSQELLAVLKARFENNLNRHEGLDWLNVQSKLEANPNKLWILNEMEETGGEPDVVDFDEKNGAYLFFDCAAESPKGRRSLCYDALALASRKENKPKDSAINLANEWGVELLTEKQYHYLQQFGKFDNKTSSWIKTPDDIRKLGGALFCDYRYGKVFTYHNGAESYYSARAFRACLSV